MKAAESISASSLRESSGFLDDIRPNKTRSLLSPDFSHAFSESLSWSHCPHRFKDEFGNVDVSVFSGRLASGLLDSQPRDRVVLLNRIKSCGRERNTRKLKIAHADVVKENLTHDVYIATALITAYAKCGILEKAHEIFEQIPRKDVASWNAVIAGYAQHGLADDAFRFFRKMKDAGVSPNSVTYICLLKACASAGSIEIGEIIDAEIRESELLMKDVLVGTALVDMYSKCGALQKAQNVFEQLPTRDVVSWSALISGYAQQGQGDEALKCFRKMQDARVRPNVVTYISVLKACGHVGSIEMGEHIDAEVRRQGLLEKDVVLGTALVDMYSKCGVLEKAKAVFYEIPVRNVVSWNALIAGYVQQGLGDEALKCLTEMQKAGVYPDTVTYISILKACGIMRRLETGEAIDKEVRKKGLLEKDAVLGTALVDMYSKCGALEKAEAALERIPVSNVVTWNALITGYVQHGFGSEALKCFNQMQTVGIHPDSVTYICILKACGMLGSLSIGELLGSEILKLELLPNDVLLGTALLDMYCKCGALQRAKEVFESLPSKTIVSWNALITGYAQLGEVDVVFHLYRKMSSEFVGPNAVTFIVLFTACSHAGLLKEGERLFDEMHDIYALTPTLEHYTCMIDLFGRAGHFDKVKALFNKASHSSYLPLFLNILGSCGKWKNVELGKWAFEQSIKLNEKCAAAYVCMQNIYAAVGMQAEAYRIKALRLQNKVGKLHTCCSWVDANARVHSFSIEDDTHPQGMQIHKKLTEIVQKSIQECYKLDLHQVEGASSDKETENVSCDHSAKLAVSFALINSSGGMPIHITMNMRICDHCHYATCLISKIEKRNIHVNDTNRIHIFRGGRCICDN